MKYLKKFEDLEYTRDEEFNYKKNLDTILNQMSTTVKIIDRQEVKNVKAVLTADCNNIDGCVKPIYGKIKIQDDIAFQVYVKNDITMLSIYKSNGIILDIDSINDIYRLFRKMSTYIGITDINLYKINKELIKIKDNVDYINTDIKID
jgi:hypothetical protein